MTSARCLWPARLAILSLTLFAVVCAASPALVQAGDTEKAGSKRVALVVANARYEHFPTLLYSTAGATVVARALTTLGFTLIGGQPIADRRKDELEKVIDYFVKSLDEADIAIFYYAGHGMEFADDNYLIPIEAKPDPASPNDVQVSALSLEKTLLAPLARRREKGVTILILDACRDNPYGRALSRPRVITRRTLVAYPTLPALTTGDATTYADALGRHLIEPGLTLYDIFDRVAADVERATNYVQRPVTFSTMAEQSRFVLRDRVPAPPGTTF